MLLIVKTVKDLRLLWLRYNLLLCLVEVAHQVLLCVLGTRSGCLVETGVTRWTHQLQVLRFIVLEMGLDFLNLFGELCSLNHHLVNVALDLSCKQVSEPQV